MCGATSGGSLRRRLLITNTVALNTGDAAILQGIIMFLGEVMSTDLELTVHDRDAAAVARYYPDMDVRPAFWSTIPPSPHRSVSGLTTAVRTRAGTLLYARGAYRSAGRTLTQAGHQFALRCAETDVVLSTGGTYLVPHYGIGPRLREYQLVLAVGRPLVFFTQSLGPFMEDRRAWRVVFNKAAAIFVRDRMSLHHLQELGVDLGRVERAPDAAFAFADPGAMSHACPEGQESALCVAVSLREWRYFRNRDTESMMAYYLHAVATMVERLIRDRGAAVTFISTCQGRAEYGFDDAAVALRVVRSLPSDVRDRVKIDGGAYTPSRLLRRLRGFDAVVATRMHMAVLAMCAGVPVLGISYEFKTRELFRDIGLEAWSLDIEDLDPAALTELALRLCDELVALRTLLAQRIPLLRTAARQPAERVAQLMA